MKNFLKGAVEKVKSAVKKVAVAAAVSASALTSTTAFATVEESISAAVSSGQSNYSLVVIGMIGMAAIGFGLSMIVRVMR